MQSVWKFERKMVRTLESLQVENFSVEMPSTAQERKVLRKQRSPSRSNSGVKSGHGLLIFRSQSTSGFSRPGAVLKVLMQGF